jgi:hypothetical protein
MFGDLWQVILSPVFVVTLGLVMAPFAVLAYSVLVTWEENRPSRSKFRPNEAMTAATPPPTIVVEQ